MGKTTRKLFPFVILIFVTSVLSSQNIVIDAPAEVIAGSEFYVKVKLPKDCLSGISRLSVDFPKDFDVKGKNSAHANYKFENGKAVYQWLTFPQGNDIELILNVSVPMVLEGHYVIKATGSYIKDSEMQNLKAEPAVVSVSPGQNTSNTNSANNDLVFTYKQFMAEGIACIRQVPYLENDEIIVNLLVSKGDNGNFGKVQETIPEGYTAVNIKGNNSMFIFNKKLRTVKYMWMNMPDKPQFLVTYKLVRNEDFNEDRPFLIYGTFQYAESSKTKTLDVQQRGVRFDLANF